MAALCNGTLMLTSVCLALPCLSSPHGPQAKFQEHLLNTCRFGRNSRVLVAVGDSFGSQRVDNQLVNRALSAAVERGAQQFILVTPLGGGGGGGFLANLFGGGSSSKQPSKVERQASRSAASMTPQA